MRQKNRRPFNLDETQNLINQLLEGNAELLQQAKEEMTKDMDRIIEYFWNPRKQKLRHRLPQSVIWFFEEDEWHETLSDMIRAQVNLSTLQLEIKNFIIKKTDNGIYFELTPEGVAYMKDKHPTVLAYWKRILELSPPTLTLFIAVIGFVASIAGIIQFVAWLTSK